MKTIGLIGGMSWESTVSYYKIINETVKEQLGGLHSGKIRLYRVDVAEIDTCQTSGECEKSGEILTGAAHNLEKAGADFIVICTNTMHKVLSIIQKKIRIPVLHIAEATAQELKKDNIKKVALLGTKYTMTQDFYKDKIQENQIEVIIPEEKDIEFVNHVIYDELCLGVINEDSRKEFKRIIEDLKASSAQGVILGCTEIGLLVQQKDSCLSVYDTTEIHARKAALAAL